MPGIVSDAQIPLLVYGEDGLLLLSSSIVHAVHNDRALVFSHFPVVP